MSDTARAPEHEGEQLQGDGPSRVVVHAGFRKAGSTSVQRLLRKNRALLEGISGFLVGISVARAVTEA